MQSRNRKTLRSPPRPAKLSDIRHARFAAFCDEPADRDDPDACAKLSNRTTEYMPMDGGRSVW
jgi:hypothetical protein